MLASVIRFSVKHAGVVLALALMLLGYGGYRLTHAGLDIFPEFSAPRVVIQTEARGLTAEQTETLVTQREESAREHDDEGRIEDAIREREEIDIIRSFLPRQLSGKALDIAVKQVVDDLGASKLTDLGRCVTALKERYPGLIEAAEAGKAVRTMLTRPR